MQDMRTTAIGAASIIYGIVTMFGWGVAQDQNNGFAMILTGIGLIFAKDSGGRPA
ncbi:MAG: hypothetical protein HQK97_04625 [Nitrospirae bacterium]|nr:hypothetical protein [Nitrospirota bacterium]